MSEKTLVERLKAGEVCAEIGQRCRVMNAESGCICAEAAIGLAQAQARIEELRKLLGEARNYLEGLELSDRIDIVLERK